MSYDIKLLCTSDHVLISKRAEKFIKNLPENPKKGVKRS